jgi:hypothetical protein
MPAKGTKGSKPGPGRPPKDFLRGRRPNGQAAKTPARMAMILMGLARGQTRTAAAALAGIHKTTLYDWVAEDVAFAESCDLAEAMAEAEVAEALKAAAATGGDWKAALAWLQHRRRTDWRPPTNTTEVSGPDGGPIALDDARAKITRVLDQYAAAKAAPGGATKADPD